MSDHSQIEWCDATWNPVRGCTKISPGCANCYAERFAERFRGVPGHAYEQGFDLRLVPALLDQPLRWQRPRRIFVNSMSDLFQDGVPIEYIDHVWTVMLLAPHHRFYVLTKRPERMRRYLNDAGLYERILHLAQAYRVARPALGNVGISNPMTHPAKWIWVGVSVENQHWKSRVIPHLVSTPAAVRFVSVEPLLENLGDISDWFPREREISQTQSVYIQGVHWVIVGGESGPGARDCAVPWIRSIKAQCVAAQIPVFVKQLGRHPRTGTAPNGGVYLHLQDRKGGNVLEWPPDLNLRQFPQVDKSVRTQYLY